MSGICFLCVEYITLWCNASVDCSLALLIVPKLIRNLYLLNLLCIINLFPKKSANTPSRFIFIGYIITSRLVISIYMS